MILTTYILCLFDTEGQIFSGMIKQLFDLLNLTCMIVWRFFFLKQHIFRNSDNDCFC